MDLYIVRHGETGYNRMGLLQGRTNIPLNQNGKKQALITKKSLENLEFDVVISSPLIRAIETARIIAPNKEILIDFRLEERYLGDYEGKPKRIYDIEAYHNYYENYKEHGVEGIQQVIARVKSLIDELKIKYPNSNVLLVTHGGLINAILYCFEPIPKNGKLRRIGLKNGEFIKYSL